MNAKLFSQVKVKMIFFRSIGRKVQPEIWIIKVMLKEEDKYFFLFYFKKTFYTGSSKKYTNTVKSASPDRSNTFSHLFEPLGDTIVIKFETFKKHFLPVMSDMRGLGIHWACFCKGHNEANGYKIIKL